MFDSSNGLMPQTSVIQHYRKQRAWQAGMRICVIGFIFTSLAMIYEFFSGLRHIGEADLVLALGCILSYFLSLKDRHGQKFVWWPLYGGILLTSNTFLYFSGGPHSPYLDEILILLFAAGLTIQTRFTIRQVSIFVASNYFFWILINFLIRLPPRMSMETALPFGREYFFMFITIIVLERFFKTEEILAGEAARKSRELEDTRDQLAHSSRLAEIGSLMASAGHELSQPVQTITLSSSLLKRQLQQPQPNFAAMKDLLEHLLHATSRLNGILMGFRDFSRKETFKPRLFDLREAVEKIRTLTEFDLRGRKVTLKVSVPENPLVIQGDPLRVEQILLNLMNNARDAAQKIDSPWITMEAGICNQWARVRVTNNGPAIPLEVQQRLFEKFFTTKRIGTGTGLGLSICQDLIRQHNGRLLFSSGDDFTAFVMDLPLAQPEQIKSSLA
jgi:signal transduction histidine kinase